MGHAKFAQESPKHVICPLLEATCGGAAVAALKDAMRSNIGIDSAKHAAPLAGKLQAT